MHKIYLLFSSCIYKDELQTLETSGTQTWEAQRKMMKMAPKPSRSKHKPFTFSILLLSLPLLFLTVNFHAQPVKQISSRPRSKLEYNRLQEPGDSESLPEWFRVIENEIGGRRKIKVGLVNIDSRLGSEYGNGLKGRAETVAVDFNWISESLEWKDFFPEWIDEEEKFSKPSCPEIPMPRSGSYHNLDVVVARVPCGSATGKRAPRDLFRLQVNLVVANLLVADGWEKGGQADRTVYAVFIGPCEPMVEIFRCDDLIKKVGDHWVYRPDQMKLQQKVLMPVGSCQLAPPYAVDGECISSLLRFTFPACFLIN